VTDKLENLNIFSGAPASFLQALPAFSGVTELALPITAETAGPATMYAIAPFKEDRQDFLAAFTDARLLNPPLIRRTALETALMLFHAPKNDLFMFNAPHPQASGQFSSLKASRRDLSLLAGFIMAGAKTDEDPVRLADGQFGLGRLHAAHYLYALAAAKNPGSRVRFALGSVLVELGLLQEAYNGLKGDRAPEAVLNLAIIHRKTGNPQAAREMLEVIGPGTPLEDRKAEERAWLDLEAGNDEEAEKAFKRLATASFDKTDALSGLGAAMAKTAFRTKDKGRLLAAVNALRSALATPSPASARVFFQLGNLYFRSGDAEQAETCYRRSAALAPSVQALANLGLTLIKTGKTAEAAAITLQVALTDMASAARLTAGFPEDTLRKLFPPPPQPVPAGNGPAAPAPAAFDTPPANSSSANTSDAPAVASLAPSQPPPAPQTSDRRPALPPVPELQIETLRDIMAASAAPTEEESRKDDFISRAFQLASSLEDELGKKVYFNPDGLEEVEKKLRLTFIKSRTTPQAGTALVMDCAAFLCFFLQERHKGRLIKTADFDPWGWPMIFEPSGLKLTTYPSQRIWRLLWEGAVPEPGWLAKYSGWVAARLKEPAPPPCGLAAARSRTPSHPERLVDAATEHKRILILASSLPETAEIELGRSGITKLENAIKNSFKPDIPPTADGWKLLRCYGHILAEIMIKDFKAAWYNADGDDGGWSLVLPWKTLFFPLGKVYKTAADRGNLGGYYDSLLAEKLRIQDGPAPSIGEN
jgi:tetratricopeptide (TPR) repeat protein